MGILIPYYTIPSNNRELQPCIRTQNPLHHYTIPSNNRELQRTNTTAESSSIIPYQVITGNYNLLPSNVRLHLIIPYQVITGNYNK